MVDTLRILVHDFAGHPFQAQLSREFARRGHTVIHAYYGPDEGRIGALETVAGDPPTLSFHAVRLSAASANCRGAGRRVRHELAYSAKLIGLVKKFKPDVVISSNTPLIVQWRTMRATHRLGAAFVFWLQDRVSIQMVRKVRLRYGWLAAPVARVVHWLEQSSLVNADAVVAITPAFQEALRDYGVKDDRINVIRNWAPLDEIVPKDRVNPWAQEHGLTEPPVFLYAGSLGIKHDPLLLVELAEGIPEAKVVVVSAGPGPELIRSESEKRGLTNVSLLPVQPYERLSEVLATADVLVAIIDREGGQYSVPSKILSYMCAGRPVLASVPTNNLGAEVIREANAGIAVEPGQLEEWLKSARNLAANADERHLLGQQARAYAERTFAIDRITDNFEALIARAINRN